MSRVRAYVYRDAAQLLLDHMDEVCERSGEKESVPSFKFMTCSAIFALFGLARGVFEAEGLTKAEEFALQAEAASHVEAFATYFGHNRWRHDPDADQPWVHDYGFWNGPIAEENQTLRIMCLLAMAEIADGREKGELL